MDIPTVRGLSIVWIHQLFVVYLQYGYTDCLVFIHSTGIPSVYGLSMVRMWGRVSRVSGRNRLAECWMLYTCDDNALRFIMRARTFASADAPRLAVRSHS